MIKREKKYREEFFKLMAENPELPVVPMVDYEVIGDDSGRWLGAWGNSYVGEYLIGEERVYFRDDENFSEVERLIRERQGDEIFEIMNDQEAREEYAGMPWIKAVVVNIDLPGAEIF